MIVSRMNQHAIQNKFLIIVDKSARAVKIEIILDSEREAAINDIDDGALIATVVHDARVQPPMKPTVRLCCQVLLAVCVVGCDLRDLLLREPKSRWAICGWDVLLNLICRRAVGRRSRRGACTSSL